MKTVIKECDICEKEVSESSKHRYTADDRVDRRTEEWGEIDVGHSEYYNYLLCEDCSAETFKIFRKIEHDNIELQKLVEVIQEKF